MKIIDVEQGSPEWLAWRKTVITGTDCPAIRGSSPWSTAYKCWQRKLDLVPEQKSNEFMERGKRLEPIIRERFIKNFGINMTPKVVESSEYAFLGASLDGLSDCRRYILEVKTGREDLYAMAQRGVIPDYYMDQMQHQLLVTAAEKCFYHVGHEDEEKDLVIEVFPDPQFAKDFIPVARAFWRCVAFIETPALQPSDYYDMSNSPTWKNLATKYRAICSQIDDLEALKEECRADILALCDDQNCVGEGIKAIKTCPKGRISYEEIPEIKGIDLNKYRKPSNIVWKVLVA